jgi:oxygen-independent coproporphyrinogen-3 oxidase
MNKSDFPGLYVHVPFCLQKCIYCDFYSVTDLSAIHPWLKALEVEAALYTDHWESFDTLYLGGGTPSLLGETDLIRLFRLLRQHFSFVKDAEITVEVNPDDLTLGKLRLFKDLGVTRLSLGVQSFCDQELFSLGRRHTAGQAESALELIRGCGFKNLSIDLIYGLPDQGITQWKQSLKRVLDFKPEHLSCYQMTIHNETPLGQSLAEGKIHPPGEEKERAFFITTSEFLEHKGYIHYEISNFASSESHFSRHNTKYWQQTSCLGLGPAAHSYNGQERWWNIKSVKNYIARLENRLLPIEDREILTEEQKRLETLFLGLRTKAGFDLSIIDCSEKSFRIIEALMASDLVKIDHNRLRPTVKGFAVADSLPLLFE